MLLRAFGESALWGIQIGSFFVQFLDWWYNDSTKGRIVLNTLPTPPPPPTEDNADLYTNKCALCRQKFRNPVAICTSG